MKFEDAKKKMSVIHKLHTARDSDGETIFYKKPYSANSITIITNNEEKLFDLSKVTHMSLAEIGILIQYKPVNIDKMYPFPLNEIEDIIIEAKE